MRAWIPWLQYPIIAFMAWVGWCLDFEKLPNNKIYSDAIVETQDAAPDLVLWGAIVWVVVKLFSWMCGPKHPSELIIERLATSALDEFRRSVFPSIEDSTEPDHHNRVTLFQHKTYCSSQVRGVRFFGHGGLVVTLGQDGSLQFQDLVM